MNCAVANRLLPMPQGLTTKIVALIMERDYFDAIGASRFMIAVKRAIIAKRVPQWIQRKSP